MFSRFMLTKLFHVLDDASLVGTHLSVREAVLI